MTHKAVPITAVEITSSLNKKGWEKHNYIIIVKNTKDGTPVLPNCLPKIRAERKNHCGSQVRQRHAIKIDGAQIVLPGDEVGWA
jgi:hypothetical protein